MLSRGKRNPLQAPLRMNLWEASNLPGKQEWKSNNLWEPEGLFQWRRIETDAELCAQDATRAKLDKEDQMKTQEILAAKNKTGPAECRGNEGGRGSLASSLILFPFAYARFFWFHRGKLVRFTSFRHCQKAKKKRGPRIIKGQATHWQKNGLLAASPLFLFWPLWR